MIPDRCISLSTHSKIKVEENRRKATLLNKGRSEYFVIKVDGCSVVNETAADFIVGNDHSGAVIIELKGKDVDHGATQVLATASLWRKVTNNPKMAALIVCNQYPKVSTTIQKKKQEFAREYKGPLHVVTANYEFELECLLSFKGPHKK